MSHHIFMLLANKYRLAVTHVRYHNDAATLANIQLVRAPRTSTSEFSVQVKCAHIRSSTFSMQRKTVLGTVKPHHTHLVRLHWTNRLTKITSLSLSHAHSLSISIYFSRTEKKIKNYVYHGTQSLRGARIPTFYAQYVNAPSFTPETRTGSLSVNVCTVFVGSLVGNNVSRYVM